MAVRQLVQEDELNTIPGLIDFREWEDEPGASFYPCRYHEVKHLLGTVYRGPPGDWRLRSWLFDARDRTVTKLWYQVIRNPRPGHARHLSTDR